MRNLQQFEALDGEELLPIELQSETTPAGALVHKELLHVEFEAETASPSCKRVSSKSAGSSASPTPPFRRVRLRQQRHRSQGQGMTAETTPPFGDAQKPWGGHPSCDPAPLTTSFGTVGQWERGHRGNGGTNEGAATQKPTELKEELSKQLGGEGRGPENPGVVAPLTSASCRGNCLWDWTSTGGVRSRRHRLRVDGLLHLTMPIVQSATSSFRST